MGEPERTDQTGQATGLSMTIDGASVSTAETLPVVNPANESIAGLSPVCTREQLDEAFDAAARAFAGWAAWPNRAEVLSAAADKIVAHKDELGALLTAELGRPIAETTGEAKVLGDWIRHFSGMKIPDELVRDDDQYFVRAVRRPIGVVAATTPWNGPLGTLGMKIGPALAAGNTIVVKPSPLAPLSTLLVGELLRDVLPPGVLNIVAGRDELGEWVNQHPVPRKLTFSGSIGVGKKIAHAAAEDLKRVTLELGGNDAAIVLADVDVPSVGKEIFRMAFGNCGQACVAIKRVYASEAIYDELVDALVAEAKAAVIGDPADVGTTLGPMISDEQRSHIDQLVREAVADGAVVAHGGEAVAGPGYFYQPTIVSEARDGMRLVDEEQFGAALPIIKYTDIESAVASANATSYALGGSVWSGDIERARALGERLEAGTVWLNTHRISLGPAQPIGGWKWSGIGIENGPWGLASFTELQTVFEARPR